MTDEQIGWLNVILDMLFEAEHNQYIKRLNALIEENDKNLGYRTEGFNYLGTCYGRNGKRLTAKGGSLLHRLTIPAVSKLMNFKKTLDWDRELIHQTLARMIAPCLTLQELRNVLPECMVNLNPRWDLVKYTRTEDPAYTIKNDPQKFRQYEKILTKIEAYCAMRFLY
jgi:hypothetical protein